MIVAFSLAAIIHVGETGSANNNSYVVGFEERIVGDPRIYCRSKHEGIIG